MVKYLPQLRRWSRVFCTAAGIAVFAGWAPTAHAQSGSASEPLRPNATGQCAGSATLSNGVKIDPYQSEGVYTVPLSGSAKYSGSVEVDEKRRRTASGRVEIKTPPLLPSITLGDQLTWGPEVTGVGEEGTVKWDLPNLIPRDVTITVTGVHNENGTAFCEGSVQIKVDGSPWDSPMTPISLVGTAALLGGLVWTGRGKVMAKKILRPIVGLLLGIFVAIDLIVFGVISFESVLVVMLPILGLLVGGVLRSAPLINDVSNRNVEPVEPNDAAIHTPADGMPKPD